MLQQVREWRGRLQARIERITAPRSAPTCPGAARPSTGPNPGDFWPQEVHRQVRERRGRLKARIRRITAIRSAPTGPGVARPATDPNPEITVPGSAPTGPGEVRPSKVSNPEITPQEGLQQVQELRNRL